MAIEQKVWARGHPKNCGGMRIDGARNDLGRHLIFAEQILPRDENILVDENDRTFHRGGRFRKSRIITRANVHDFSGNAVSRNRGRPADGNGANGEGFRREDFDAGVALTPTDSYRKVFGVHVVYARVTKRFDAPSNRAIGCGRTRDATSDRVRQVSKIFLER